MCDSIPAGSYSGQSGTQRENGTVGYFDAGDYVGYDGVDLTGVTSIDVTLASNNWGGVFTFRVDSSAGTQLASYAVQSTNTGSTVRLDPATGQALWTSTLGFALGVFRRLHRGSQRRDADRYLWRRRQDRQ